MERRPPDAPRPPCHRHRLPRVCPKRSSVATPTVAPAPRLLRSPPRRPACLVFAAPVHTPSAAPQGARTAPAQPVEVSDASAFSARCGVTVTPRTRMKPAAAVLSTRRSAAWQWSYVGTAFHCGLKLRAQMSLSSGLLCSVLFYRPMGLPGAVCLFWRSVCCPAAPTAVEFKTTRSQTWRAFGFCAATQFQRSQL